MKKLTAVVLVVCCVIVVAGCGVQSIEQSSGELKANVTPTPTMSEPEQPHEVDNSYFKPASEEHSDVVEVDTSMMFVLISSGYTVEQASEIQQILNTIGITSINDLQMTGTADGLNAGACYPNGYTDEEHKFWFSTDKGELFYAGFRGEDLYDSELGGYLKSYDDVHIPETAVDTDTFAALQALAEEDIRGCLSHPASALFDYFSWAVGRSDEHYKIIGVVSASNSLGVKDDLNFAAWYVLNDDLFVLEGVEVDGTRVK